MENENKHETVNCLANVDRGIVIAISSEYSPHDSLYWQFAYTIFGVDSTSSTVFEEWYHREMVRSLGLHIKNFFLLAGNR